MSFLAFPLRLQGAFLQRTDETMAVLRLLEMMASTPSGSWAGCPSFGIRDVLEGMRLRPEHMSQVAARMNRALEDLGISRYRVESIVREPGDSGVDEYTLTIVNTQDPNKRVTSRVRSNAG